MANLTAANIHDTYSIGPSIRPVFTRCCFTKTNMIRVCSNFHRAGQVIDLNDPERIELYGRVSLLTIIAWACYPLVWLLGTGFGGIGVSVEV